MSKPFELLDAAYEEFPRPITDDNGECDTSANVEVMQTNPLDKNGKKCMREIFPDLIRGTNLSR